MKRFALAVCAALSVTPLAACGGSEAPAVQEARVEEARLKEFLGFFPKPLNGWTASAPVFKTGDDKSSVSVSQSTVDGDQFLMQITFSNAEAEKFMKLVDDDKERRKNNAELASFGGTTGLSFARNSLTAASYVVLASPSRTVSVYPVAGDKIMPVVRAQFEKIDFAGIGAK
jgi:hypothetical protein